MKKEAKKNVHLHIKDAFTIIDKYLPYRYVDKTKEFVDAADGSIRNVRNSRSGNLTIVKALLKVALAEKETLEELKSKN